MLNFENRLEADKHRNEMVLEFKRSLEKDENFLQLTNSEAIDYINLGDYMACVMEEFKKSLNYKLHLKALKNNNKEEEKGEEKGEGEDIRSN